MEDIKLFETFYRGLKITTTIICIFPTLLGLRGVFSGKLEGFFIGIAVILGTIMLWYVINFIIHLQKIIVTRFIAMTENIYEITTILEKNET